MPITGGDPNITHFINQLEERLEGLKLPSFQDLADRLAALEAKVGTTPAAAEKIAEQVVEQAIPSQPPKVAAGKLKASW